MPAILKDITWLDIFFVILLFGMIYKGLMVGVGSQILSLLGWFAILFLSIQYYEALSKTIFGFLLKNWAKPVSFFAIIAAIFAAIKTLERIFNISIEHIIAVTERAAGALIASVRAFIIFGLTGILFLLVPLDYTHTIAIERSKMCMFFVEIDTAVYSWVSGVIPKIEKREKDKVIEEFLMVAEEGGG